MDGRGALRMSVCLLIITAGCRTQVWNVPKSSTNSLGSSPPPMPAPDQVKKKPAKPKELPPLVLVSAGDWKALEAFAPGTPQERQQAVGELARADYEKALKSDPQCVQAYHGLAGLYSGLQEYPLAVENYQKALKLAPKDAALWYELGRCHHRRKNWGPALVCLKRATQLDPGNRSYADTQGVLLAAVGHYDESLNCFVHSNGEALGYYRLAQTLQRLQQTELSKRYFEAAVQRDPGLATQMAMHASSEEACDAKPAIIQQTAYQPLIAAPQQAPATPLPQVTTLESAPSVPQPSNRPIAIPSPPSMDEDSVKPNS